MEFFKLCSGLPLEQRMGKENSRGLTTHPLRVAGEGVQESIDKLDRGVAESAALAGMAIGLMAMEWWRYFRPSAASPWVTTFIALLIVCFVGRRVIRDRKKRRSLKLGRDGERLVAEQLERLRSNGFHIFHDVVAGEFNLDHVAIGPTGIFVVETKARTKNGAGVRVEFDGKVCRVHGREMEPNPLRQAEANARWLYQFLRQTTGKARFVTPVIVFPEWWVERQNRADVRVLNHKEVACLAEGRAVLDKEDISCAVFHLDQFARRRVEA